jgi:hypothetical protein
MGGSLFAGPPFASGLLRLLERRKWVPLEGWLALDEGTTYAFESLSSQREGLRVCHAKGGQRRCAPAFSGVLTALDRGVAGKRRGAIVPSVGSQGPAGSMTMTASVAATSNSSVAKPSAASRMVRTFTPMSLWSQSASFPTAHVAQCNPPRPVVILVTIKSIDHTSRTVCCALGKKEAIIAKLLA